LAEEIKQCLENEEKGWTWFQNKKVDKVKEGDINMHIYYTWKIHNEKGESQSSTPWNTEGVLNSGKFERLDNQAIKGYYQWKLK